MSILADYLLSLFAIEVSCIVRDSRDCEIHMTIKFNVYECPLLVDLLGRELVVIVMATHVLGHLIEVANMNLQRQL